MLKDQFDKPRIDSSRTTSGVNSSPHLIEALHFSRSLVNGAALPNSSSSRYDEEMHGLEDLQFHRCHPDTGRARLRSWSLRLENIWRLQSGTANGSCERSTSEAAAVGESKELVRQSTRRRLAARGFSAFCGVVLGPAPQRRRWAGS